MAVKVDIDKCDAYDSCGEVCPVTVIYMEDKAVINEEECIDYNTYIIAYLDEAIEL